MSAPFSLPPLPYADNALDPVISANTIGFHYGKHHKTYLDNLNKLVEGKDLAQMSLEEVIMASAGKSDMVGVFNNAAQVWNHTFYWNSLTPGGGGKPGGTIGSMIDASFGDYESFKKEFANAAVTQFGSGWAWLVQDGGALKIMKTGNAELPMSSGKKAVLTIDVWEHAYYLDYQNLRAKYVETVIDKLLNWSFAEKNLAS